MIIRQKNAVHLSAKKTKRDKFVQTDGTNMSLINVRVHLQLLLLQPKKSDVSRLLWMAVSTLVDLKPSVHPAIPAISLTDRCDKRQKIYRPNIIENRHKYGLIHIWLTTNIT